MTVMNDTWRKFVVSPTFEVLGRRLTRLEESKRGVMKRSGSASSFGAASPEVRGRGNTLLEGLKRFLPKKSAQKVCPL